MGSAADQALPAETGNDAGVKQTAVIGMGSVWFAMAQAACATSVFLKSIAVVLGISVVGAAGALELFHGHAARAILLAFALSGATANLYLVWNAWRLRRNPAARWRLRPLSTAERRRIAIAVSTSLLTFVVLALEVWAHFYLHPRG
ncbi:MAG TPA: hypothetical protein VMS96_05245 [Terriglobales bacterium]|nr:hypothetical protein [Terriglobales bacterium]